MTAVYIERTSTVLSFDDTGMNFSRNEIDAIKKIWSLLRIVLASGFAGSNSQVNKSTIPNIRQEDDLLLAFMPMVARLNVINMNFGSSVGIDDERSNVFVFKLKSNLLQYISLNHDSEGGTYNNFDVSKFEDTMFDHLPELIRLISNIIYDLENIHNNRSGLLGMGKICSRIWNFDVNHYNLIGEALVLTILEHVGRNEFSTELEFTWLKFYNKVSQLLQSEGEDSFFDLPVLEETPRSRFTSDTTTLSTISPKSSINFPDDDIYSVRELPSVEQDLDAFNLLNGIDEEEEEDDDSYDLINVFGYSQPEIKSPKKKGYTSPIKRFRSRSKPRY
ncbi:unnamed protein product [Debaryomyces tyrocola]|nr:unnamed protein product [Debaryomyces tyrocola]